MNTHAHNFTPRSTPEQRAAREAAEHAATLVNIDAVQKAADWLGTTLRLSGGRYKAAQSYALFNLCNAMIGLIDDGDCLHQRDVLMDELRIDEDGNPDGDGDERASFGMHHPDSPSFGS